MGVPALGYGLSDALPSVLAMSAVRGVGFAILTVTGSATVALLVPPARLGAAIGVYGLAIALPMLLWLPASVPDRGRPRVLGGVRARCPAGGRHPGGRGARPGGDPRGPAAAGPGRPVAVGGGGWRAGRDRGRVVVRCARCGPARRRARRPAPPGRAGDGHPALGHPHRRRDHDLPAAAGRQRARRAQPVPALAGRGTEPLAGRLAGRPGRPEAVPGPVVAAHRGRDGHRRLVGGPVATDLGAAAGGDRARHRLRRAAEPHPDGRVPGGQPGPGQPGQRGLEHGLRRRNRPRRAGHRLPGRRVLVPGGLRGAGRGLPGRGRRGRGRFPLRPGRAPRRPARPSCCRRRAARTPWCPRRARRAGPRPAASWAR